MITTMLAFSSPASPEWYRRRFGNGFSSVRTTLATASCPWTPPGPKRQADPAVPVGGRHRACVGHGMPYNRYRAAIYRGTRLSLRLNEVNQGSRQWTSPTTPRAIVAHRHRCSAIGGHARRGNDRRSCVNWRTPPPLRRGTSPRVAVGWATAVKLVSETRGAGLRRLVGRGAAEPGRQVGHGLHAVGSEAGCRRDRRRVRPDAAGHQDLQHRRLFESEQGNILGIDRPPSLEKPWSANSFSQGTRPTNSAFPSRAAGSACPTISSGRKAFRTRRR